MRSWKGSEFEDAYGYFEKQPDFQKARAWN